MVAVEDLKLAEFVGLADFPMSVRMRRLSGEHPRQTTFVRVATNQGFNVQLFMDWADRRHLKFLRGEGNSFAFENEN